MLHHLARIVISAAVFFSAYAATTHAAGAQNAVEAFYRGRTVTIVVGSAVGGGFDAYARLVGRHLGRFIPGNPTALLKVVLAAELVLCELHQFAMSSAGCGEGLILAGRAKFEPHWPCPSSGTPVVWGSKASSRCGSAQATSAAGRALG